MPPAALLRRLGVAVCLLSLLALGAVPAGASAEDVRTRTTTLHRDLPGQSGDRQAEIVPGRLLVTSVDAPSAAALRRWVVRPGGLRAQVDAVTDRVTAVKVHAEDTARAAAALRSGLGVLAVEPERRYTYSAVPDDPLYDEQWAHQLADAEPAWDIATGSADVRVAVLDSGVFGVHDDLAPHVEAQFDATVAPVVRQQAPADNATCPTTIGFGTARKHGTWVAGVVGAVGDNATGISGAAWQVSLVDVALSSARDPDSCLGPKDDAILRALAVVRDYPYRVDVVNLSLGSPQEHCPAHLQVALDELRERGTSVVVAAGNEGAGNPSVPAVCRGVIAVGAAGADGTGASYSNTGAHLSLAGPGGHAGCSGVRSCVLTTDRDDGYSVVSGTSFAAPYVAGVAALIRSHQPDLAPDQVQTLLESTARHPDGSGVRDDRLGWGVVQAGEALHWLAEGTPVPRRPDADAPYLRVGGEGGTQAIGQAVAMSRSTFRDDAAAHVLIARVDDYADALAGSGLGYGVGPILFNPPTGGLVAPTREELQRVLPDGGVVYLLGGSGALDSRLEEDVAALGRGYQVRRLAGPTREATAAVVSRELERRLGELGTARNTAAILATRGNWPDAVTAGSLAASFGLPVLLTEPDRLHPETAGELSRLGVSTLYVIGGTGVIDDATARAASQAAGLAGAHRLGGPARDHTAVAVAHELTAQLRGNGVAPPTYAIAVNMDRADGYAHALSATGLAGAAGGVFVPVRGEAGDLVTAPAREYACDLRTTAVLAGGADLLADASGVLLADLLRGRCTG